MCSIILANLVAAEAGEQEQGQEQGQGEEQGQEQGEEQEEEQGEALANQASFVGGRAQGAHLKGGIMVF